MKLAALALRVRHANGKPARSRAILVTRSRVILVTRSRVILVTRNSVKHAGNVRRGVNGPREANGVIVDRGLSVRIADRVRSAPSAVERRVPARTNRVRQDNLVKLSRGKFQ